MSTDVGTERDQVQDAIGDLGGVLEPLFARRGIDYALIAFGKPPSFASFRSNLTRDQLVMRLKELVGRLESGDLYVDGDEPEPAKKL